MRKIPDVREMGSWQLSALLAVVQALLLLFAAMGPQHGDSAIGSAMQAGWAIAMFLVQLLVVTPVVVFRAIKLGHDFGTSFDLWLFGPLAVGPLSFLLALVVSSARA